MKILQMSMFSPHFFAENETKGVHRAVVNKTLLKPETDIFEKVPQDCDIFRQYSFF